MAVANRFRKAWNAFRQLETPDGTAGSQHMMNVGTQIYAGNAPSRPRSMYSSEKTIIESIYTRLAIDVGDIEYRHVVVDANERYLKNKDSSLNDALRFEPNLDQSASQLRRDIAKTLFHEGVAAIVPVDTSVDPMTNAIFDIYTLRVGSIVAWFPKHVKVSIYNEATGKRQEVLLEKRFVAIVENPFYDVMNETNSTLRRLVAKLNMLDVVDEQSSSGKLDLIIQLPYVIKSEARRKEAEQRRSDIQLQLRDSQYGIAYTDGTEKITQLNRPAENNLLTQVEFLVGMLYQQLGLTEDVMNGTADEKTMLNYQHRTILPIVDAIAQSLQRSFLGLDRYKDNERIAYFLDVFKFVPLADIAEMADKFTRNEIATANEIRGVIGLAPSSDPKADELKNSNMPQLESVSAPAVKPETPTKELLPGPGRPPKALDS